MRAHVLAAPLATLLVTALPFAGAAPTARADDAVARGRDLAVQHCGRCHVVDRENRMRGISSTPSFPLLVDALADWRDRFETFHARRPHPAIIRVEGIDPPTDDPPPNAPVHLTQADVDAIVAYAVSLHAATAKP